MIKYYNLLLKKRSNTKHLRLKNTQTKHDHGIVYRNNTKIIRDNNYFPLYTADNQYTVPLVQGDDVMYVLHAQTMVSGNGHHNLSEDTIGGTSLCTLSVYDEDGDTNFLFDFVSEPSSGGAYFVIDDASKS